jgi:hypothetical protein
MTLRWPPLRKVQSLKPLAVNHTATSAVSSANTKAGLQNVYASDDLLQ